MSKERTRSSFFGENPLDVFLNSDKLARTASQIPTEEDDGYGNHPAVRLDRCQHHRLGHGPHLRLGPQAALAVARPSSSARNPLAFFILLCYSL